MKEKDGGCDCGLEDGREGAGLNMEEEAGFMHILMDIGTKIKVYRH